LLKNTIILTTIILTTIILTTIILTTIIIKGSRNKDVKILIYLLNKS